MMAEVANLPAAPVPAPRRSRSRDAVEAEFISPAPPTRLATGRQGQRDLQVRVMYISKQLPRGEEDKLTDPGK